MLRMRSAGPAAALRDGLRVRLETRLILLRGHSPSSIVTAILASSG